MEPRRGKALGERYVIIGALNRGRFWVTLLALARGTNNLVVAKTLSDDCRPSLAMRERFSDQAHKWADLYAHPNVVPAHFCEEIDGRLFMLAEYVAADERGLNTLERRLQRGPLELTQAIRWGVELAKALRHAADGGLTPHLDVSPSNLVLTTHGRLKLSGIGLMDVLVNGLSEDLGSVIERHRGGVGLCFETTNGRAIGRPPYMAPEQFLDVRACDQRADIYAAGVVLYQLVSGGKLPFTAQNPVDDSIAETGRYLADMYQAHRTGDVPKLGNPLSPIIERCLRKDSGQRYQTIAELEADLVGLLAGYGDEVVEPERSKLEADELLNRGLGLHAAGYFDEALDAFELAEARNPSDPWLWRSRASCFHDVAKYEEALGCAETALKHDPELSMAWMDKALTNRALVRRAHAMDAIDRALQVDRLEPIFWLVKALLHEDTERFEDANRCYRHALERSGDLPHVHATVARSLGQQGRLEEALQCCERCLEIDDRDDTVWVDRGTALMNLERRQEAMSCFEQAANLNEDNFVAWFRLGQVADDMDLSDDAAHAYKRFLRIAPPQFAKQISHAHERIEEFKAAGVGRAVTTAGGVPFRPGAEAKDPKAAALFHERALACRREKDVDEAIRCFRKALALDPTSTDIWADAADMMVETGDTDEAVRCARSAVELEPTQVDVWLKLGKVLRTIEVHRQARGCYERALQLNPNAIDAWIGKGESILATHERSQTGHSELDEALHCFERALRADPNRGLSWYWKGAALRANGQLEEALESFQRAMDLEPGLAQAWSEAGVLNIQLGRFAEGLGACQRAADIGDLDGRTSVINSSLPGPCYCDLLHTRYRIGAVGNFDT